MPKFAANLTMLFTERPFLERFAAARAAGFDAVEFLFPYAWPARQIQELLIQHRLRLVLHNLPAGDWDAGERGIACLPDRTEEFRAGVARAIAYATALDVPQLNCLIGKVPADADPRQVDEAVIENLRHAATELARHGKRLVVEPINTFDIPGFYLHGTAQALRLIEQVGADNLFVQYDIYHMQRMEGEIAATLQKHLAQIGHVQLADNPGRHEPGTGELNWRFLFAHLDRIGYDGWIGCEYQPATTTEAGLGWIEALSR
ncbi:MAG: hydroxypyruvate isomerase [Comamonas sp.]|nr:hydroxypyruvate isomerase [Comamonas sp.]